MKKIIAHTDGSFIHNTQNGGYGSLIEHPDGTVEAISGGEHGTTSQRMEIQAVLSTLSHLPDGSDVEIRSDSAYVVNAMNKWLPRWERNGYKKADGKPISNMDQWKEMRTVLKNKKVQLTKVKAHSKDSPLQNEIVDVLARDEAMCV